MCYSNRDRNKFRPFSHCTKTLCVFYIAPRRYKKYYDCKILERARIYRPVKGFVVGIEIRGILYRDVCAQTAVSTDTHYA